MKTITIHPAPVTGFATGPAPAPTAGARRLRINVLRCNPQQRETVPHWQLYEIDDAEGMTLFIALSEIREKLDPSLQFDFVCRAGICGSCAMLVNGRPALACRTLTKDLGGDITLAPLPASANMGKEHEKPSAFVYTRMADETK